MKNKPPSPFGNWIKNSGGQMTRRILARKKIISPPMNNRILIKPGLWMEPKEPIHTEEEKQQFIQAMKEKFNIL